MAKREFSAGGIVFRTKDNVFEVLLIKDAYGRWTWPKGHIDQGESSQEAAIREVREEVGLRNLRILGRAGRTNYFFRLKGALIFKTVFYFLMEADKKEVIKVETDEIEDAKWFKPEVALKKVKYKGAKKMLDEAIQKYKAERK